MSSFQRRFGLLFLLSTSGYLLSFGNQLVISYYFGTSKALDAYWTLLAIANLMAFYVHPLREALVPPLHAATTDDRERASVLFSAGLAVQLVLSLASAILLLIAPSGLLEYIGVEKSLALEAKSWLFIYLLSFGFAEICNGLLISFNQVIYQATARVVSAFIGLVCLGLLSEQLGVLALGISLLTAQLVSLIVSWVGLKEKRIFWVWRGFSPLWRNSQFRSLFGMLLIVYLLAQIYAVFERSIMSAMVPGLLASYQYSTSLVNVLISLIAYPIANLLWPHFLNNEASGMRVNSLRLVVRMSAFLFYAMMIFCAFIWSNAHEIVFLIYSRGVFDQSSVDSTAEILRATVFTAVPIGVGAILGRWLISQQFAFQQFWVSLFATLSGFLTIFIAYKFNDSQLIVWHWFFASLTGFAVVGLLLIYRGKYSLLELISTSFWILRVGLVVAISIWILPTFDFGSQKIFKAIELCTRAMLFFIFIVIFSWLSGIGKEILFILEEMDLSMKKISFR